MHLKEGYRLHNGKYQLLNILGEGGFSLTYKGAWKTEVQGPLGKVPTQIPVCIKEYFFKDYCLRNTYSNFIETNSATGKEIFDKYKENIIKEARILSEIHHPNVVNVLEVFKQNNTVYIVMEFISGFSLKQELEKNGIYSEDQLIQIVYKIGQALQYIHEKNILHLDVKPSNVLMDRNQNPQLIDFGISKRYDLSDQQETSTTMQAASKGYASIEQYDSEGMQSFSPCPDIYSLGATMYYLLTGQVPTESILRSTKGLQNPRELNPKISEHTEKVILKAMALNASDRYQTMIEMLTDLGYNPETDKVNTSISPDKDDEKTELLYRIKEQPYDADIDDETVLHPNEAEDLDKNSKGKIVLYLIPVVLIIGLLIFLLYGNIGSGSAGEETSIQTENSNDIIFSQYFKNGVNNFFNNDFTQAKNEFLKALEIKPDNPEALSYIHRIDSLSLLLSDSNIPASSTEIEQPTGTKNIPESITPNDTIQESYNKSIKNGNTAFNQKDYKTAKIYFQEAFSYKKTTEAQKFIKLCDIELEKLEIENRKESYVMLMDFGTFVVAKKKSNGLFGAIDSKGFEKIPCKYKSSFLIGKNRFFARTTDDSYDEYSPTGDLIHEATTGE